MKKLHIIFWIVFIFLINSCRYDDGPLISFRTAFGRLYGVWEVEYFEINGINYTQEYKDNCNCIFHFGYYSYNRLFYENNQTRISSIVNINHDQKNILHVSSDGSSIVKYEFIGNSFISEWEVKKLTNQKLWIKSVYNDYDNNKIYYIELKKIKDEEK